MAARSERARRNPAPRLYTIPQTVSFLDALAGAVLTGELPRTGGEPPDPLALTQMTILLPTRRACRALRDAFLEVGDGQVALLPSIRALGDADEDAAFFANIGDSAGEISSLPDLPEAIGAMDRRLIIMQLIMKWCEVSRSALGGPASPAQAAQLADGLIGLLDMAETEQADLSGLARLVPDRFANHWQDTISFLEILTKEWPQILAERGQTSPFARRNALMEAEARRIAETPPQHPIIAAGSTGSIPATAKLLKAIARTPMGAVVLPGLDLDLDDESWDIIPQDHPEHPQFGMRQLLQGLGANRDDVVWLPGCEPDGVQRARIRLASETMRPAATTDRWQVLRGLRGDEETAAGAAAIAKIEAPSQEEEAEAVALILRHALEDQDKTAALVTPDRDLVRRVIARMRKWGLRIDDSAGEPLAKTPPGALMALIAEIAERDFAPVVLLSLLKHPLVRLGRPAAVVRETARTLEIAALRGRVASDGLAGVAQALADARDKLKRGGARGVALRRIGEDQLEAASVLLGDLRQAFSELTTLHEAAGSVPISRLARAHVAVAEALALDETGDTSSPWQGEAGETLVLLLGEILNSPTAGPPIAPRHYSEVFAAFAAPLLVRRARGKQSRLRIWGPLEARLQRVDVVVLGGLNEGTWPRAEDVDAWFSRPMREELGLPQPERRLGLSAHDFSQLLGAEQVFLTRALKVDGVPSVPSRWLLRLEAVLAAMGLAGTLEPAEPWVQWTRARDHVAEYAKPERPSPCPPVEARPRRMSVTWVEEWIANPYAVFARQILQLEALGELAASPDAALRGQVVHDVLARFAERYPDHLPENPDAALMAIADELIAKAGAHAGVRAFWRPQLARFARWFADSEPARRQGVERSFAEVQGRLAIASASGEFELRARADRIDRRAGGGLAVYDYKTGRPPSQAEVSDGRAPQLPLEAAIAIGGGFDTIAPAEVVALRYIWASGARVAGEEREASRTEIAQLAQDVLAGLKRLVAQFDAADTCYPALRRRQFAHTFAYDDYAHLARTAEWAQGLGGD